MEDKILYETPIMASANSPAPYQITESIVGQGGFEGWRAFNGIKTGNDGWYDYNAPSVSKPKWITIKLDKKRAINRLELSSRDTFSQMAKDFAVFGSNDNSTFTKIFEKKNETWSSNQTKIYDFDNSKDYLYYRLEIYSSISSNVTVISEIKYLQRDIPINRILFLQKNGEVNSVDKSTSSIIQIPSASEQNLINYGIDSPVQIDGIFSNKNYILQDTVSEDVNGLWKTQINRKPLSIKFN